jgi:ABC-2 type transport system ATP-binding protein
MTAAFLEVIDLHKRYGARTALERVGFKVVEGEMFGLLGPNGAGKTTLLSIVSCLLGATAGEVRLLGRRLGLADREARRLIGIVPQELAVYDELTARENLLFFGQLYGVKGPPLRHKADEVLAAVGLADRADQRTATFSGGMKRRLNLAAALVHGPRLLLLDEPTAGVDPQSRKHLFEEVRRLNAAGVTIVYTSHYMEEVQGLCTRIGILDQGHLVACDTLPHLLQLLPGRLRFGVSALPPELLRRLQELPDCRLIDPGRRPPELEIASGILRTFAISPYLVAKVRKIPDAIELECRDVKATLVRLGAALREAGVELTHLETEEPNLENVFLHLTGTGLRD